MVGDGAKRRRTRWFAFVLAVVATAAAAFKCVICRSFVGGSHGPQEVARPRVTRRLFDIFGAAKSMLGEPERSEVPLDGDSEPGVSGRGGPDAPPGFDTRNQLLDIVRYPHPALRRANDPVTVFDGRLRQLVANLFRTMYATGDGIGLAAPQVGVNLRLMVYNPNPDTKDDETVFINPRITSYSSTTDRKEESCLSFPRMRGPVDRPIWVEVEAMDWQGNLFQRRIEGFEARLFQHEYDHLDGVVYIDRLGEAARTKVQGDLDFMIADFQRAGGEPAL